MRGDGASGGSGGDGAINGGSGVDWASGEPGADSRKRPKLSGAAALQAVFDAETESDDLDSETDGNDELVEEEIDEEDAEESNSSEEGRERNGDVEEIQAGGRLFRWITEPTVAMEYTFTGTPGLCVPLTDIDDPLEIFERFIDNDIIDNIVTQTNLRASQLMNNPQLKMQSRLNKWTDVTAEEVKVFLALNIYQGIVRKPEYAMYWTTDPMYDTPFVRTVISINLTNFLTN